MQCIYCDKYFEDKWSFAHKNRVRKFCSMDCFSKNGRKDISGKKNHFWKGGKAKLTCDFCGKCFENYLSNIRNNKNKFCSTSCSMKHFHSLGKTQKSEQVWNWRGDQVGYSALHKWINSRKDKPKKCEHCEFVKKLDLANISGEYKRDVDDYFYLCRSCHLRYDRGNIQ